MTQITFELGDHPKETGVFVNPDVRWTLTEFAEEILKYGEAAFIKTHCYYESKLKDGAKTDAFDKYQPGGYHGENFQEVINGTVRRTSNNNPVVNTSTTSRKTSYDIKVGDKMIGSHNNKVQMVHKILSYLIENQGYSPTDLNELYKNRYFKFPLLKSFPRGDDIDVMKKKLDKDQTRFGLRYIIEAESLIWVPCSQWNPNNTKQFINDILKFNEVIDEQIAVIEI